MIIMGREAVVNVGGRRAIDQDVMSGLNVEGLFYLGVGSNQEMDEHQRWDRQRQKGIWRGSMSLFGLGEREWGHLGDGEAVTTRGMTDREPPC